MRASARPLLSALRPRQWVKNVLVFAAPLAAGRLDEGEVLGATILAFAAFCLAASATYLVNDVIDAEADRLHPWKHTRPVAAGHLSPQVALVGAGALAALSVGAAALTRPVFVAVLLAYLILTLSYSIRLKLVPWLELAVVTTGFVLRAVGGGAATGIELSLWFLVVTSAGSMVVIAGKRLGELIHSDGRPARRTLEHYSVAGLRAATAVAGAIAVGAYGLWALDDGGPSTTALAVASTIPFATAIIRYLMLVHSGQAEDPEEVLLGDRVFQAAGLTWTAVYLLSVYG